MNPSLLCLACGTALRSVSPGDDKVTCSVCGEGYAVRLGILDLRGARMRVAGAEFEADRDLAKAAELNATLQKTTYREWFFSGVDQTLQQIPDVRQRALMQKYYRDERAMFGVHGDAILAKLDSYLEAKEPARFSAWRADGSVALEAGCGTGQYPIGFARRFSSVFVTDLSFISLVQARKVAQDFGLHQVHVFASNIERLPLASGSVDFVHCNGVIEHVADPERALAECSRVLSPTGVALILSPNKYTLYTEAHFRVPGFGFWPMPLRRRLARRMSGARSFAGTELRSLRELRRYARASFGHFRIYMLPRRLVATARSGWIRRSARYLLGLPVIGSLLDVVINRLLLPVMPYNVLVGFRR